MYAILIAFLFVFIKMDYPFIPIQLTLISVLTIGIPSFILALEPNHNRVKGKFIINVISKSIPAAITIFLNIISIVLLSKFNNVDSEYVSTMSVILVAFTGFVLLFKVCKPFNQIRIAMFLGLVISFLIGAIGLSTIFELVLLKPVQFIFIAVACIIDIILFTSLTEICSKKIFKHEERIVK
jgi:cation-transporting ATPase E